MSEPKACTVFLIFPCKSLLLLLPLVFRDLCRSIAISREISNGDSARCKFALSVHAEYRERTRIGPRIKKAASMWSISCKDFLMMVLTLFQRCMLRESCVTGPVNRDCTEITTSLELSMIHKARNFCENVHDGCQPSNDHS